MRMRMAEESGLGWTLPLLALAALCASCALNTHGEMAEPEGTGGSSAGSGGMSAGTGGAGGTSQGGSSQGGSSQGGSSQGGSSQGGSSQAGTGGASDAGDDAVSEDVVVGTEDCLNGVDDNADQKVDCDDPQCTKDYLCVPASPAGFGSPGTVKERAIGDPALKCTLDVSATYNGEPSAPKAACACACGAPAGGTCSTTYKAGLWANETCDSTSAWLPNAAIDCEFMGQTVIPASVKANGQPAVATKGTCGSSVTYQPTTPVWGKAADVCASSKVGTCATGVCVPKPTGKPCVVATGDLACSGSYTKKLVYYEAFADTRGCDTTGCVCDPAAGEACQAKIQLFSDSNCQTLLKEIPLVDTCTKTTVAEYAWSEHVVVGTPSGGACAAKGSGTLTGEVSGASPHTACCVP
ncbi:MAG: hypothetical protein HY898_32385 [Deltaproteobacteria bacterium]|nr:hypothetical protein [Deltaproteobacteria bacterium]